MFYVGVEQPGPASSLKILHTDTPTPGPGELLVRVRAAALNYADTLQRAGLYAPPEGQPQIMGVELSGEIAAMGPDVNGWKVGDQVFGLCNGGAYAEYCLLNASMAIPLPENLSHAQAAALPEAYFTSHETLVERGGLEAGKTVLVHAGGSGIGTGALQIVQALGARGFFTAGSDTKIQACTKLSHQMGINYKEQDFAKVIHEQTEGRGVDMVLDFVGGPYLPRNLDVLAPDGRMLLVGVLAESSGNLDMLQVIMKRLHLIGFSMRGQSLQNKIGIVQRFRKHWLPRIEAGEVGPVIHSTYPMEQAFRAHEEMEAKRNVGKIILTSD